MSYEFQLKRIADALEESNKLISKRMKQCMGGEDSTFTSHSILPPSENSSDFASPSSTSKKKKEK